MSNHEVYVALQAWKAIFRNIINTGETAKLLESLYEAWDKAIDIANNVFGMLVYDDW